MNLDDYFYHLQFGEGSGSGTKTRSGSEIPDIPFEGPESGTVIDNFGS